MIKLIALLKKRNGMSTEDFRDYYKNTHSVLGRKSILYADRYVRKFLNPAEGTETMDQPYDVITEVWYSSREACEKSQAHFNEPEIRAALTEDEDKLFDRPSMRFYTVEEDEDVMTNR